MPPLPAALRLGHAADPAHAEFRAQVHDALTRLHDPPGLETHPLALPALAARVADLGRATTPGQALRRSLLEAVDALEPVSTRPTDRRAGRAHQLLTRRYVDGASLGAVQRDLTVSRSEYFREHGRAVEAVAAVLWQRWGPIGSSSGRSADAAETGPVPVRVRTRSNLPTQSTSLVGRDSDVADVRMLLGESRLVTLTGTGGVGKTRLALRVGVESLDAFPDGVWLAALASLPDPDLVAPAVLAALGVAERSDRSPLDLLLDYLRDRRALLVLDNCEHLVERCAALVDSLLGRCPGVRVLATSREVLRVAGEAVRRVPSLSADPALQLFVDRARAAEPRFAPTPENLAEAGRICQRLDGIPLAIELAAVRLRLLPIEEIGRRLDDRFHLLNAGERTALPRHQTLRALIDWSHEFLSEAERALVRRLAVFAGGFTLEAAELVCAFPPLASDDNLHVIGSLVDKSLVVAESGRYRLLETIRQYETEKLIESGDEGTARARHAGWCEALCDQANRAFRGADQRAWLDRLELELDNLRAALARAATRHDPAQGLRLLGSSLWFWFLHYHRREAAGWADRLLKLDGDVPPLVRAAGLRTRAMCGQGTPADRAIGYQCALESVAICRAARDGRGTGESLHALACMARWLARSDEARALLDEGVALGREAGDEPLLAMLLATYGGLGLSEADEGLEDPLEEGRALAERLGDTISVAMACRGLAAIARTRGDTGRAIALYQEDLARCRVLGDSVGIWVVLTHLGGAHLTLGDGDRAAATFREALSVMAESRAHGHPHELRALEGLARIQVDKEPTRAVRLLAAAEALWVHHWTTAQPRPAADEAFRDDLRNRLGPDAFGAAWDVGLAMTPEQAVDYALDD